jgi:hypothetical protein
MVGWLLSTISVAATRAALVALAYDERVNTNRQVVLAETAPEGNRVFADLDAREATLVGRCQALRADRPTIRSHTRFHW